MKPKHRILIFVLLQTIILNGTACNLNNEKTGNSDANNTLSKEEGNKENRDTLVNLQLISQYKTGESEFFKTENEYPVSTVLYKGNIFLMNYADNKLIVIDIEKKTTTTNAQINKIIAENSNVYSGVCQIVVTDQYFFIGFLRAIICVTKEGEIVSKIVSDINIQYFTVNENSIIVFYLDSIARFDSQGQKLSSVKLENSLTGHFFSSEKVVYISEGNYMDTYNTDQVDAKKALVRTTISIHVKEPYLFSATSNYTAWFPYMTRDQIVFLDKTSNEVIRTIKFNKDFAPTEKEIDFEQGRPQFSIVSDNAGSYYIIAIKNKLLEVYYCPIK